MPMFKFFFFNFKKMMIEEFLMNITRTELACLSNSLKFLGEISFSLLIL